MSFDDWFEELLMIAMSYSVKVHRLIQQAPFMYEDYYEDGMSPEDAFYEEWGHL